MHKIEWIKSPRGDWEVLKVDGRIYEENHKIDSDTWANLLLSAGVEVVESYISDEEMENGIYRWK